MGVQCHILDFKKIMSILFISSYRIFPLMSHANILLVKNFMYVLGEKDS